MYAEYHMSYLLTNFMNFSDFLLRRLSRIGEPRIGLRLGLRVGLYPLPVSLIIFGRYDIWRVGLTLRVGLKIGFFRIQNQKGKNRVKNTWSVLGSSRLN